MGFWEGKRVAVTGGTGFLGSHVVRRLVREGAVVCVVDRSRKQGDLDRLADSWGAFEWCQIDLEDRRALGMTLQRLQPSYVFHLAGRVDLSRTAEMAEACMRENVFATANLLWALEGVALEAFVFASSTEVYGHNPLPFHEDQPLDPPSPYAISKVAAEHLCRFFAKAYRFPTVIVRISTVYGPQQAEARLIPSAILAILHGEPLKMTSGEQRRDFIYIEDAVEGVLRAATVPAARGETINLGSEHAISLREVIDTIRRLMGTSWQPVYGALVRRIGEPEVWSCSWGKAKRLLDWEPSTSLAEGLGEVIKAYRARVARSSHRGVRSTLVRT